MIFTHNIQNPEGKRPRGFAFDKSFDLEHGKHIQPFAVKGDFIARDCFGMGISDYIRNERIKRARHMLLTTTDSVASVAAAVGIADTNYFIRAFKSVVGVTPLQYRKGNGKEK